MSESETQKQTAYQDPTLHIGDKPTFRNIDLHSPEILEQLTAKGELFRRKIEPVRGVREPSEEETIETVVNGIVESTQVAKPGEHKIITGSRGEEFVFSNAKYNSLYTLDEADNVIPRERFIVAMQNPYKESIRTEAPWSTPEDPKFTDGTSEAMLAFSLNDKGELTDDRYIIGDREMLLANYDPFVRDKEDS
jgi:hypothetical protein